MKFINLTFHQTYTMNKTNKLDDIMTQKLIERQVCVCVLVINIHHIFMLVKIVANPEKPSIIFLFYI